MSQLQKLRKKAQKEYNKKIKRQKFTFSFFFIFTVAVSFLMLIVCAVNNMPTLAMTIISGSVWLIFDIVFAYAIKQKWHILFDECSTGLHYNYNQDKTESERKRDNWYGNYFKFVISLIILVVHLVLFFILL